MNTTSAKIDSESSSLRKFWIMWVGQLFSILGSEIVGFAIIWWITGQTTDTRLVSYSFFLLFLPQILLNPLAGFLTDRLNRKMLMIIADLYQALITGIIIVLVYFNAISIVGLIIMNAVRSCGGVFHQNALSAMIPQLVPKKKLSQINGLKFLTEFGVRIIGSLVAAIIVAVMTLNHILWIDVITFMLATLFLISINVPTLEQVKAKKNVKKQKHWVRWN